MAGVVTTDQTQLSFPLKTPARKKRIFKDMKDDLFGQFSANGMYQIEDCLQFMEYCESKLNKSARVSHPDTIMKRQLKSLCLADRNRLISLLTHINGELNTEMLQSFPGLERRSRILLENKTRKERKDKIDLSKN